MSDKHTHPNKIVITSEERQSSIIDQHIELQGCESFIIEALSNIFLTLHKKNPEIFIMALGSAIEKIEELK